jgi:hypothetical protein
MRDVNRVEHWYRHRGVRFWIGWTGFGLVYVIVSGIRSLSPAGIVAMVAGYCVVSAGVIAAYYRTFVRSSPRAQLRRQIILISCACAFISFCLAALLASAYNATDWHELLWLGGGALAGFAPAFMYLSARPRAA